jgi:hypothetical protein
VAEDYRGQGIFDGLYAKHKSELSDLFELCPEHSSFRFRKWYKKCTIFISFLDSCVTGWEKIKVQNFFSISLSVIDSFTHN